jgi:CubicO group peptidase (beta-lactamase class C family)
MLFAGQPGNHAQTQARPADQVDRLFEKWNKAGSPGCALSVMKDGRIVYERGYGMADLDHDVPITPRSVFHVASVSKQFTAASILLLADEGKLSLDDDVRKYIPELPDFGERIAIRHLIHHTSGLRDQWDLLGLAGWRYSLDLITDDDVLALMTRQKELNFPPGDRHLYCASGTPEVEPGITRACNQRLVHQSRGKHPLCSRFSGEGIGIRPESRENPQLPFQEMESRGGHLNRA